MLLLHANEVVSTDRLVDSLWGEAAPNTAATAVHGYVSGLRKALGDHGGRLATAPRGYTLRIEPGELDLDRFERFLDSGREQLAADGPERAAETLRAGARVVARQAARRLRGRAVGARGRRTAGGAADPGPRGADRGRAGARRGRRAGGGAAFAGERAPVPRAIPSPADARALPCRTSGRGARDLRRRAPGHGGRARPRAGAGATRSAAGDPRARPRARRACAAASGRPLSAPAVRTRRRRGGGGRRGGGAAALWLPARGDDAAGAAARAGNALVLLDPRSGDVREAVAVGATPVAVALGEGAAWVVNADAQTLSRVDAETRETTTFGPAGLRRTSRPATGRSRWATASHCARRSSPGC